MGKGDLDLTSGQQLTANQVTLSADSGAIDIAGTINAPSGDSRGFIGLYAQNDVTLEAAGTLNASASSINDDSSGRGGDIELSTVSGTINLPASATSANGISTAGAQQQGSLLLRAPTVNGDDVQISQIDSNLRGVGQITIEPVLQAADYDQYGTGAMPAGDVTTETNIDNITSTVNGYFQAASGVIPARLQPQAATGLQAGFPSLLIEPGVVINETAATTTLTQSLDLTSQTNPLDFPLLTPIDLTGARRRLIEHLRQHHRWQLRSGRWHAWSDRYQWRLSCLIVAAVRGRGQSCQCQPAGSDAWRGGHSHAGHAPRQGGAGRDPADRHGGHRPGLCRQYRHQSLFFRLHHG